VLFCYQVLKKIAKFIQEQNEKIYAPQGLLLTDPIERGLRVVSFRSFLDCLLVCPSVMCYLFISVWHPLVMRTAEYVISLVTLHYGLFSSKISAH